MSKSTSPKTKLTISTGENYIIRNAASSFREKFIFHGGMSKVCSKCKKDKPITHYHWKEGKKRLQAECSGCRKVQEHKLKCSNPEGFVRYLAKAVNYNYTTSKRKRKNSKLSAEELVEMWLRQKARFGMKCPYSGVEMTYKLGDGGLETNISIDRFDSKKDYERGNVIFCCWFVNRMKFTYDYPDLIKVCKQIVKAEGQLAKIQEYLTSDERPGGQEKR